MATNVSVQDIANGALGELFEYELQKITDNIHDPNTDATKIRKMVLTLTFKPDKEREVVATDINIESKLAPVKGLTTKLLIDHNYNTGETVATEYKSQMSGQVSLNELDETVRTENNENIISFQAKEATKC